MKTPQVLILSSLLVLVASAPIEKRKVDILKEWENYTYAVCNRTGHNLERHISVYVRDNYNLPEGKVSCWKGKEDIIFSFEVMDKDHVLKKVLFEKITLKQVQSQNKTQVEKATVKTTLAAPMVTR